MFSLFFLKIDWSRSPNFSGDQITVLLSIFFRTGETLIHLVLKWQSKNFKVFKIRFFYQIITFQSDGFFFYFHFLSNEKNYFYVFQVFNYNNFMKFSGTNCN